MTGSVVTESEIWPVLVQKKGDSSSTPTTVPEELMPFAEASLDPPCGKTVEYEEPVGVQTAAP